MKREIGLLLPDKLHIAHIGALKSSHCATPVLMR